jgi:hypothetical protein
MKHLILILLAAVLCSSCNKKDGSPTQTQGSQESVTDYFPLTVGSYWIYQIKETDTLGNIITSVMYDSVFIKKDSIYNGKTYKVMADSYGGGSVLLCDSSGYIVSSNGRKYFTTNADTSIINHQYYNDTTFYLSWKMKQTDSLVSVPAGEFAAKIVEGTLVALKPISNVSQARYLCYAYSKNIGLIYQRQCYLESSIYQEHYLIRYHVQ